MDIKQTVKDAHARLGTPMLLLTIAVILGIGFLAVTGAYDWITQWNADRKIQQYEQKAKEHEAEAAEWKRKADEATAEANQYKGAAAVYKQQTEALMNERSELKNEQTVLRENTRKSTEKVAAIRKQKPKPANNITDAEIDNFSRKLDQLYPSQ